MLRRIRTLPHRTGLAVAHPALDHPEIAVDILRIDLQLLQAAPRQRQQLRLQQTVAP